MLVAISGDGQVAPPQSEFAQDLVVEAQNDGTPLGGVPVTFTVRSGDVFFLDANGVPVRTKTVTTTTAAPGARTSVFSGDPGNAQIDVTAPGYASTAFALLVQAQQASLIKQSGDGQQGPTNSQLPLPLVAMLPPNTVSSQNAVITFEVIGGSATFVESNGTTASVPVTDQRGSVRLLLGAQPGDVQVRASYPGLQSVVFNARAVQPTSSLTLLKIAGDGQLGTTGLASAPLRVRLTRNGQPISQGDVDWRVVSGDATLSETHTKTDDRGETQVTLALGDDAGGIRVRVDARDSGSGESASTEFQLGSGDATLTAVSGSGQNGAIGTDADQVFVFELRGADGSPLAGQTIQFQTSSGALASPSAITASDGRVSARLRYGSNAGQVQVTAFAFDGRVHAVGVASTFVPLLSIAGGNNQSAPAGAQLPNPLVIQISRPAAASMAKGLQGLTVQWSVVSGGGTLASATSVTDAEGRSSNTLRLGPTLGAQQIKASIAEVGEVVFAANATIPANSVLEIVSGNNQQVVPRRPSEPLVVRLRTSTGTGIAGFVVKFVPSDGASVDPIEVTTNQDGRASTVVNVTLPGDYTITASVPAVAAITPVVFNLGNGIANLIEVAGANRRIARAIDKACPRLAQAQNLTPAQQDLLQRCSELVVAARDNGGAVAGALDTMLADESSAQNNAALQSAAAQFENIKGRFAALRSGSSGINMGGLAILTPSGRLPLSFLPSNLLLGAAEEEQPQVPDSFSRWGFFATGTIGRGSRDAGDTDPGGDFDNYGLTAGIDYRLTDSFILGGALGFNSNDSSLKQNLGGLDSRGYSLSAYGTWFKGDSYYADGVLTVGRTSTDVTRRIEYTIPGLSGGSTAIRQIATGSPDNDQRSFALSVGRDFNRGALSFGPYLRGTYTKLDFDGYIERMSDPNGPGAGLALAVDERSLTSMQAVLGAKLGYTVSTSWGVLMPSVQIEYVKELEDDPDGLVTRFAFDPTNTAIVIDGDEIDTDYLNIGIGLSGVFADGRSGYIYYEHVAGKDRISQDSLAIGIRIEF